MRTYWITVPTVLAAILLSGCGESTTTDDTTTGAVTNAARVTGDEAAKAADATKEAVGSAAKSVQDAAAEAGAAVQETYNQLVADAKRLIAEGKQSEAVQKIESTVSNLKLSPEQQKVIDDLLRDAQAGLKKAGDALTPPKPPN